MASTKLMASSTSRNSDPKRKSSSSSSSAKSSSSISHLQIDVPNSVTYSDNNRASAPANTLLDTEITLLDSAGNVDAGETHRRRTVDEVWREIVAGKRVCKKEAVDDDDNGMMTLEDFLVKANAVEKKEEDVKVEELSTERLSSGMFAFDQAMIGSQRGSEGLIGFGSGVEEMGGGGRGKRRAILEPLDKVEQQRQRRMIKNRESAARSRERKQAYQAELESLVVKLEEEKELLLKEKEQRTKERLKQLMDNVIPAVEKRRPQRILRRVRSTHW